MKVITFKIVLILIFSIFQINLSNAQIKKDSIKDNSHIEIKDSISKKSYFKLSMGYLSNYVYNGRIDSIASPYIKPSIGYLNENGFNASVTGYYLNLAKEHKFDFVSLDVNYEYKFNDNFSMGLFANRTFYQKSSNFIKSNIIGDLGSNVDYDLGFIELYVGADLLFSQKKDFALDVELDHEFSFKNKNNEFKIIPTLSINFSSLNYYEGYLNKKNGKKNAPNNSGISSFSALTTVDNNRFTLLDYEFSAPLTYEIKHFILFVTPTFAVPKNTINTTTVTTTKFIDGTESSITKNSTSQEEYELKSNFFIEFGGCYKFD